jgi:hypothetical protein
MAPSCTLGMKTLSISECSFLPFEVLWEGWSDWQNFRCSCQCLTFCAFFDNYVYKYLLYLATFSQEKYVISLTKYATGNRWGDFLKRNGWFFHQQIMPLCLGAQEYLFCFVCVYSVMDTIELTLLTSRLPGAYPTKSYKYWLTNICNLHILHFWHF